MSAIAKALDTIEKLQRERDEAKSEISAWKAKHADVSARMARNASERDEAREQNDRYRKSIAITDANFRRLQTERDALLDVAAAAKYLMEPGSDQNDIGMLATALAKLKSP